MTVHLLVNGKPCRVRVVKGVDGKDAYEFALEGSEWQPVELSAAAVLPGTMSLVLADGTSLLAQLDKTPQATAVVTDGRRYEFAAHDPRSLSVRRSQLDGDSGPVTLKSPMPGRIVRILRAAGSAVEAKQGVLMVEAMKMQNELKSPKTGVVESVLVAEGDTVTAGQALAVIR
jgi:biotin carboxyl carrier protein